MNSSSSGTANSDASYVTRAESIPSAMRASEAESKFQFEAFYVEK